MQVTIILIIKVMVFNNLRSATLVQVMAWCRQATRLYLNQCHWTNSKFNIHAHICKNHDFNTLTHWGPVRHICVSKQTIIGSDNDSSSGRCQAIINLCWNIVNLKLRNKLQWNFSWNSNILIQGNLFEDVVWKMATILSWPKCVKRMITTLMMLQYQNYMVQ